MHLKKALFSEVRGPAVLFERTFSRMMKLKSKEQGCDDYWLKKMENLTWLTRGVNKMDLAAKIV